MSVQYSIALIEATLYSVSLLEVDEFQDLFDTSQIIP